MMPSSSGQRKLIAEWQELSKLRFEEMANAWIDGRLSLSDFQLMFKQELKDLYIASVWTATGSPKATTAANYGRAGRALRDQYQFMRDFFGEIEAGNKSLPEIKNQMNMYANSSTAIFERIATGDEPQLPYVPGDGSTQCRANCNCTVDWTSVEGGWDVTWQVNPGESCPDCLARNGQVIIIRNNQIVNPGIWG